ncbi:hypothetical protein PRIPAC_75624, partial [Pristionchus pacificus]
IRGSHLSSIDQNICYKSLSNLFVLYSPQGPIALEIDPSYDNSVQSAIEFTNREFRVSQLLEKSIVKLSGKKGIRIQIGRFPTPSKLVFAVGFWCERDEKIMERQCDRESDTKTEGYVIPEEAEDNFNDLSLDDLLFDYRVSIADIERATKLNLLPQSMDPPIRRRVSLLIPNSIWPDKDDQNEPHSNT